MAFAAAPGAPAQPAPGIPPPSRSDIRTSYGMFFDRQEDEVISYVEKKLSEWSLIPPGHGEGIQARHRAGPRAAGHAWQPCTLCAAARLAPGAESWRHNAPPPRNSIPPAGAAVRQRPRVQAAL